MHFSSSNQTRAIPEDPRGRQTALVGSTARVLERAPNALRGEAETQDGWVLPKKRPVLSGLTGREEESLTSHLHTANTHFQNRI